MSQRTIRRTGFISALVLVLLVLVYFGLRAYSGHVLAREVDSIADAAAGQPGMTINTLSYEPGLLNGELQVDLEFRALPEAFTALLPDRNQSARIDGQARVTQGPVWAPGTGLAWARAEFRGLSADALAPWVPDLQPDDLLQGVVLVQADGRLSATGTVAARETLPQNGRTGLTWDTGQFTFDLAEQARSYSAHLQLPALEQHGPRGWRTTGARLDVTRNADGETTLELASDTFRYQADNGNPESLAIDEPRLSLQTRPADDGSRTHRLTGSSGALRLPYATLDATTLGLSLSNVPPGALDDLLNTATLAVVEGPSPALRRRIPEQLRQLVLAGAVLDITPASVSLGEPDNISGQARIGLRTESGELPADSLSSPLTLLRYAEVELEAAVTLGALRRITRLQAEAQARDLEANRGLDRSEEETRRLAASAYRSALLTLQFMPLVTVSDGQASVALALRDQVIYRNGERLMSLEQLLSLLTGR